MSEYLDKITLNGTDYDLHDTGSREAIAPEYDALTFPVSAGQPCWHEGTLYRAKQDIPSSESWTAAHWEATAIWEGIAGAQQSIDAVDLSSEFSNYHVHICDNMPVIRAKEASASDSRRVGYTRIGNLAILDGTVKSGDTYYLKLNGTPTRTYDTSTVDAWADPIALISGHTYQMRLKHINGDGLTTDIGLWAVKAGTHAPVGTIHRTSDGMYIRDFVADTTNYQLMLAIGNGATFSEDQYIYGLIDVTAMQAHDLVYQAAGEIKSEVTAHLYDWHDYTPGFIGGSYVYSAYSVGNTLNPADIRTNSTMCYIIIPVVANRHYVFSSTVATGNATRGYILTDSAYKVLLLGTSNGSYTDKEIVPKKNGYLIVNSKIESSHSLTDYIYRNDFLLDEYNGTLNDGSFSVAPEMIESGSYDSRQKIGKSNHLRFHRLIPVKAGDKVIYTTDTLQIGIAIYAGDATSLSNSSGWVSGAENAEYIVPYDGLLALLFRKSNESAVTVADYDATVRVCYTQINRFVQKSSIADQGAYHFLGLTPIPMLWERGSIGDTGELNDDTRLRQKGYLELFNDIRVECDAGYMVAARMYTYDGTSYTDTGTLSGWVSSLETTRNLVLGNYIRLAIKRTDGAIITPPEAEYVHVYGFNDGTNEYFENPLFHNVCHRGFNVVAPENTIPAFALARKVGFRYIETDVQFTADNVAVILHDRSISRTSNGTGNIDEMTFAQVREYDFGAWKNALYTGTQIPSFEEMIIWCKRSGVKPYIELKAEVAYTQAQISSLVATAAAYGILDQCTWISFSVDMLGYVHNADSHARLGYLVSNKITAANVTALIALRGENEVFFLPYNGSHNIDTTTFALAIAENIKIEACIIDNDTLFAAMDARYSGNITNGYPTNRKLWELANG